MIGIEAAHANKAERTGVEEVCFELIQNLKEIIPPMESVVLYSNQALHGGLEQLTNNWQAKVLSWPFKKMWSQIRLSWEFWKNRPDIYIAPGQLIPFFCPKKTIVVVHDSAFLVHPPAYHFWGRQYLKWMNKRIVNRAILIITPSQFSKDELIKYYRLDPCKIKVVPLGYDCQSFYLLSEKEKHKSKEVLSYYRINKPFLLSINRLETKKNTRKTVEAFNILKKDFDLELVLIGKPGAGYAQVAEAISNSPFKKDIKELGWVDEEHLVHFLNSAQLFFLPSIYEGFGLPLLNALACGCPVVAAKGNSLEEVGGEAAQYASPLQSDELAQKAAIILSDANIREEYRQRGFAQVKNFSWKKFAEGVWTAIISLL